MNSNDFFIPGLCNSCQQEDLIGCWDGEWMCEDCYIDSLDNDDLLERIEHG